MQYIFIGLGNPGKEYKEMRHNAGRIVLEEFCKKRDFSEWDMSSKYKSLESSGVINKKRVLVLLPETFMNKSGEAARLAESDKKQVQKMAVVHDDLDLPIGTYKLSWNRGSGGHRGVESIIRALKTEEFLRVRVGISPVTPGGKMKKPKGVEVEKVILGKFKTAELAALKKISKRISSALESFVVDGKDKAMSMWNG